MIWAFCDPVYPIPKIRPDLMLIGDNPSWFDRVDMTLA